MLEYDRYSYGMASFINRPDGEYSVGVIDR